MNGNGPDVIVIMGAPGAGKTQTAKRLANHFPAGVRMEIDSLRSMVISVEWTNQKEHVAILSLSADLVLGFLRLRYRPVIVVDTFSGDKLDKYLSDLRQKDEEVTILTFALVVDSEELKRRLEARRPDEFRDLAVSEQLNKRVIRCPHSTVDVFNTTGLTPEETAQRILAKILRAEHASK